MTMKMMIDIRIKGKTDDKYHIWYATETMKLGGIPIIMIPVTKRNWKNGNFINENVKYVQICKNVASKLNISYIEAFMVKLL